MKGSYIF